MRLAVRITVAAVLLTALVGLCVHYGETYDEQWPHPTGDQLRDNYDEFVGERVLLFGDVQSVDPETDTVRIHVTDSADEVAVALEVHGITDPVAPGGTVQVYGVLEADRTLTSDETVVVNRDPAAATYKLVISIAGILLAIGYFVRYWRLNRRQLGFEPRHSDSGSRASKSRTATDAAEVDQDG